VIWTPDASREFERWISSAPYGNWIAGHFLDGVVLLNVERGCEYVRMWVRPPFMVRRADGAVRLVDWDGEDGGDLVVDAPSIPVHRRSVPPRGWTGIRSVVAEDLFIDGLSADPVVYVSDSVPPEDGRFR
jgi:hypothetical protein